MTDYVPAAGDTRTHERTFTRADVEAFADLSEDEGYHHLVADDDGAVVVHGLLTATIPTKLGGDIDFLARDMHFEFPRPVYTGETITCEMRIETVAEEADRYRLDATFECSNEGGEVVLSGETSGVVFK